MLTWRHPLLPPSPLRIFLEETFGSRVSIGNPTSSLFKNSQRAGQSRLTRITDRRGLRSLPHLREQLKPRTDDGHASPALLSEEGSSFLKFSAKFQALVRFFVYRRIKPHDPPLVRVPVYSFEF